MTATAAGIAPAIFSATGISLGTPRLEIVSGNVQRSKADLLLPLPIVVRVVDGAGDPVSGVGVAVSATGPGGGGIVGVGGGALLDTVVMNFRHACG